jgi:hypothetical protein
MLVTDILYPLQRVRTLEGNTRILVDILLYCSLVRHCALYVDNDKLTRLIYTPPSSDMTGSLIASVESTRF